MTPANILETALYLSDLDAAEAFYGDLLGLEKITRVRNRHVFYRVGQGVLLLFNPSETTRPTQNPKLPVPTHGATGSGHVCFATDAEELVDIRAMLVQAGIEIEADFNWPNGARSIYVRDPGGNSVEFVEPRLWFG